MLFEKSENLLVFANPPASVLLSPPPPPVDPGARIFSSLLSLQPPPLTDRLAIAGFSPISMRKAAVGERVKPEDEAPKSSPNFLPGGGVGEAGRWEQRRPGEEWRLRLYYMHLRPEKLRTMRLRNGQLRTGHPPAFSVERRGRGGREVKRGRRGTGKVNFKRV